MKYVRSCAGVVGMCEKGQAEGVIHACMHTLQCSLPGPTHAELARAAHQQFHQAPHLAWKHGPPLQQAARRQIPQPPQQVCHLGHAMGGHTKQARYASGAGRRQRGRDKVGP